MYAGIILFLLLFGVRYILLTRANTLTTNTPGALVMQERIPSHYLEFFPRNLMMCAEECYTRKRCTVFSFSQKMSYCELGIEIETNMATPPTNNTSDFTTSFIHTWSKELFGKCRDHDCSENERCNFESGQCEKSDCGPAPSPGDSSVLLSYGHHEVNNGVIYRCTEGSTMFVDGQVRTENEYVLICNNNGTWGNMSYTCLPSLTAVTSTKTPYDCQAIPDGNWTVIQSRCDGSENFLRGWQDYKYGFGDTSKEHWIGNEVLYEMTSSNEYKLKIELEDFDGERRFALYSHFAVGDENSKYTLSVSGYSGTAGDSLSMHDGMQFSTIDNDNDYNNNWNCSAMFSGAWWYKACHHSNLNGLYLHGNHISFANGINWRAWRGYYYSYKYCKMMIMQI